MFRLVFSIIAALGATLSGAFAQSDGLYPSTYVAKESPTTAIINATILTAAGPRIDGGTIILSGGKITAIGKDVSVPQNANVIDANGRWITPGIIDAHSHLGVFPSPSLPSNRDGNEKTGNNTAEVWAEHAIWPQDPAFDAARDGGVTSLVVLPGSTNLFGGRSVTLKNVPAVSVQAMKFPDAPQGLKMACGENPVRLYGSKARTPFTRMGNIAGFREHWQKAKAYQQKRLKHRTAVRAGSAKPDAFTVDLQLETLADVLDGKIIPHIHCYRADEMTQMVDVSKEFGFNIGAFHHAVEAYKIADMLAKENIGVATWANRWGFKFEAYDAIDANAAILEKAGVNTILHSDSAKLIQRLNVEAALGMASARRSGLNFDRETAIKWITANPAKLLDIIDETGTLEVGKMADVVLWSADPFSVYARADQVYIDGVLMVDRATNEYQNHSDFELGQPGLGE
ncbi:amidohydrolase [Hyphococcus lacteus]|uniref:Amidohydrolase family protein n=1 Tax=Hyphococcus lacteus TaxID=3143536 RepID=A0ABV3Z7J8_9PROT